MSLNKDRLLRVIDVDAHYERVPRAWGYEEIEIPVISCTLETGEEFKLYYVPYEIVKAIKKMRGEDQDQKPRESIFDILPYFSKAVENIGRIIEKVVIDELEESREGSYYTAKLYLNLEKMKMIIPMIPSHAIYLALITNKPIYVSAQLVRDQLEEE